ncbi:MAG: prolyl oligopeptidase family protein [Halobacteriaceae archaeon]
MTTPPATEKRAVTENLHGNTIVDPYRWLENDSEEVRSWIEKQNEYADTFLSASFSDELESRMESLARITDYSSITARDDYYFQRIEPPDADQAKLCMRANPEADPIDLVDPNEWDTAEEQSLDWYVPSPDGEFIAYGVATGGTEQYDIHILETDTQTDIDKVANTGRTNAGGLAWTEDGFYYIQTGRPSEGSQLDKSLWYHDLTSTEEDVLISDAFDDDVWPQLETNETGDVLLVTVHHATTNSELYRVRENNLEGVLTDTEAAFYPTIHNETVYLRTNYDAPFSKIVALDITDTGTIPQISDPEELRTIIPESDAVLANFTTTAERLIVHYLHDACSQLTVYDLHGEKEHDVTVDDNSSITQLHGNPFGSDCFYRIESFDRPPTVVWLETDDQTQTELARPSLDIPEDIEVTQKWFTSDDGTEIPLFIVHRSDIEHDGDNPTVIYGYGGFRVNLTPQFNRFQIPFIEDGGIYVQVCLRGGAEFGEQWHEAGMLDNKQNVFDDFIGAAEYLIEQDYTNPDRLASLGRSNGGLLVGAAITQRPELYRAAVSVVPLLDMLRFHRFLLGKSWTTEYGSPDDPDDFKFLKEYSPYHNVQKDSYPAILLKTALGDTRVHPSHARKMTARLQENNIGPHPIILRTETETGHGVGKPTSMTIREKTEEWTFIYDQLGLQPNEDPTSNN